jgi:hypothetical protein
MKSAITKAGLVAVAGLALAAPAKAATMNFDYYCVGSGALQACASVRVQSIGTQLTMQVWNLNGTMGGQHTIVDIGLYHAASDWSGVVNSYTVNYIDHNNVANLIDKKYWTAKGAADIGNLAGVKIELAEGNSGNAGIIGCTDPGGLIKWATCWNGGSSYPGAPYVEFKFNLSSNFALSADTELRWHSQQLANGNSVKCDTGGAGDYPICDGVTVTPEPGSLALVATGLVAFLGVTTRRRRVS